MSFEFKTRTYLHFDAPIGRETAENLVVDAKAVSKHAFFPFISHTIITRKIRRRRGGGVDNREPKRREIMYAGHADSQIFSWYSKVLQDKYEYAVHNSGLDHVVTAFRKTRREHHGKAVGWKSTHFANEAFNFIRDKGSCAVLAMDFADFFGNINHTILKSVWCYLLGVERLPDDHYKVFQAVTKYSKVERSALFARLGIDGARVKRRRGFRLCSAHQFRELVRGGGLLEVNRAAKGIPQGAPLSATLSNIYLLQFDRAIHAFASEHDGLYRRYCDDILLVLPTKELCGEAERLICQWCERLKLPVNAEKTERFDFGQPGGRPLASKPLQYLGFTFDGIHKRVRPASVAKYYKKMRAGVRRAKAIRSRADRRVGSARVSTLRCKKLYLHYTYLGRHNFPAYVFEAARIMNDTGIKKQVKKHWKRLQQTIHGD